jgi:hypothetical protein
MLAFWTGRDPDRIDRLVRASGLYRKKWERNDYRTQTIALAVRDCAETYGSLPRNVGASKTYSTTEVGALRAKLHEAFGSYLVLEETEHIDFALAVAISAELDGDPLWGYSSEHPRAPRPRRSARSPAEPPTHSTR